MENNIECPKCKSKNISSAKKGFSGKNAAIGVVATGGIGLLAGTIGSNKMMITCLNCGIEYKAKDYSVEKVKYERIRKQNMQGESDLPLIFVCFIVGFIGMFISYKLFSSEWNVLGTIFSIVTVLVFAFGVFGIWNSVDEAKTKKLRKEKRALDEKEKLEVK